MSDLITKEIFTDGQQGIAASNMNGIVSRATVQPDVIASKPVSATLNIADTILVLKTDNTLAQARFDVFVNSTSSTLPLADTTKNGMLRQGSGNTTDYVDGTNNCRPLPPIPPFIPVGTVWDTLATVAPAGWLLLNGASYLRTDYPALFALISTTYGAVDGTHFNVPDCRGRGTICAGQGSGLTNRVLGARSGEESHQLTLAELAAHTHIQDPHTHLMNVTGYAVAAGSTASVMSAAGLTTTSATTATNQNAGSNGLHNNMQPFLVTNKMVKT